MQCPREEPGLLGRAVLKQQHRVLDRHESVLRALFLLVDAILGGRVITLTLISNSRVDGLWMMPVSSSENFFCALALYSSTDLKPCFIAIAGVNLVRVSLSPVKSNREEEEE